MISPWIAIIVGLYFVIVAGFTLDWLIERFL